MGGLHHLAVGDDLGAGRRPKAAGPQQGAGGQADEAVAPEALAAHHGFKQKAVLAAVLGVRQLQVERERGFQVRKGLGHERNAVVAFAGQAFEFKFCDHGEGSQLWQRVSLSMKKGRCGPFGRPHRIGVEATGARWGGCPGAIRRSKRQADARAKLPGRCNL